MSLEKKEFCNIENNYSQINENINILNFEEAIEQWLKFVFKNRQSDELVHQYDIVIRNEFLKIRGYNVK